jgi:acylphosphatase
VHNRPDGKVEAVFEGAPDAVEALVGWCSVGPIRARVVRVEVTEELPLGGHGFSVR